MAHDLLRSQKNAVFELIQQAGFDPAEFEWRQRLSAWPSSEIPTIPSLLHVPTGFSFGFEWKQGQHVAWYSPGNEGINSGYLAAPRWDVQLAHVRQWLKNLAREYTAPNLWGELAKQRELAAATAEAGNDEDDRPFTVDEQVVVAQQLDEIKSLVMRNEQLDAEGQRRLEASIEHLKEESRRMGRREWLTIFYGTVFPWALSGLVSPDGVRQAIMLAAHGLAHLFGVPPAQLMP